MKTVISRFLPFIETALIVLASTQAFANEGDSRSINQQDINDKSSWLLSYDGYVESGSKYERDFDLNEDKSNDISSHKLEAGFEFLVETGNQFNIYVETELSRLDYIENETNKTEKGWELIVEQAYFDLIDEQENFTWRIGRQRFKDDMEWIYDANLDGVRLFYNKEPFSLELSMTEEDSFDGNFLDAEYDKDEEIRNFVVLVSFAPKKKSSFLGYLIYSDEDEFEGNKPEDLLFVGLQSLGGENAGFKHWLNAAYVVGEREGSKDTRDIEAYGYDLGGTLIGDFSSKPSITLGFAYGSGDAERNEGKDENFRQTGFQDNYFRFNGVTKFKYLGEIFDPEITNISIATLGLGIRPTKKSSIDIVYHIYQQDVAVDRLTGTDIDRDPKGISKELGRELDIIFGSKELKNVYMEAILALFEPGEAFKSNADDAFFLYFEIGYEF